jgi:3-hydroxyacyl-CoA dehydrogenase/enoyl-CoA hydratase/3-hydroxybutyryl-CoA epimerase
VIASNTSSLPISDIAAEADRPERVLGMHYFSPVSQMPLVEIIRTPETSEAALATAVDVGLQQGKTVIVVGDGPGFYTTRILAVFMNEALLLLEEGADAEAIDTCMEDFGFPMGPYELFDLVGIEVAAKITDVMSDYLDAERLSISSAAETLVENNLLGQKNGRGFYLYEEDDAGDQEKQRFNEAVYRHFGGEPRTTPAAETVQRRLTLLMVNEAARCLEDDILQTPVDGDLGAVFGLGFPPFRGGPFRYVDQVGADVIVRRLQQLADTHGARFAPATILQSHATAGTTFHGDA